MNRPLVWAALGLAGGIAFGAQHSGTVSLLTFLVTAIVAWVIADRSLAIRDRALVATVFLAAGLTLGWSSNLRARLDPMATYARDHLSSGAVLTVEGIVRSGMLYRPGENGRFILDVDTVALPEGPMPLRGGVSVRCFAPSAAIFAGERVRLRGSIDPTLSQVNFGLNSIEDYLRARGIHLGLSADYGHLERLGAARWWPAHWTEHLRQAESDLLARCIPAESLPFILAVWLGEGATIGHAEYDDFIASGTAHVLSVSGVHVAIVYFALNAMLALAIRHRKRRALCVIVGIALYSLLAGAQIATVRSAVMFGLFLGAELFDREPDAPTALSLSALLFLLFRPVYIFDAGFLLSFASIASMLLFNDAIVARLPWRLGAVREPLAAAASAQILPLPFAAHYFHLLPIYGIAANLVVVPLLSAVLWLCALTTLAGACFTPAGQLFGHATHVVVLLVQWIVHRAAALPGSYTLLSSPAWYAVPFFWAAALIATRALGNDLHLRRNALIAGALFVVACLLWTPRGERGAVDMLDVGHGDATVIRTPGGGSILVDGGDRDEYRDCGRSIVVPFLLAHGVRTLDCIVLSHPDRDHIGGLFEVIRRLHVKTVLMSASESDAKLEQQFVALCAARGVPVQRLKRGDKLEVFGATLEALHPPVDWGNDEAINNRSLVLRVSWPDFSLLCSGDIERPAERVLAGAGECRARFLKVPHHGSGTSSTEEFLAAVAPELALCSTDARPNRRPMDAQVIARYARHDVALKRTDYLGGLHLHLAEGRWQVEGAREARGYALAPLSAAGASIAQK